MKLLCRLLQRLHDVLLTDSKSQFKCKYLCSHMKNGYFICVEVFMCSLAQLGRFLNLVLQSYQSLQITKNWGTNPPAITKFHCI